MVEPVVAPDVDQGLVLTDVAQDHDVDADLVQKFRSEKHKIESNRSRIAENRFRIAIRIAAYQS